VFSNSFTTGTLSVRANALTGCNSALSSLTIVGAPAQPGSITVSSPFFGIGSASINSVAGASTYNWTLSNGNITLGQGTTGINFSMPISSTGTLCVRASNSCGASAYRCVTVNSFQGGGTQQSQMLEDEWTAEEDFKEPVVYPNPAEDVIRMSFENSAIDGNVSVDLLDANGLLLHRANYNAEYGTTLQLSLTDLPVGMYVLRSCSPNGKVHTQRFIKQ
jgi:hypothetical protein